MAADKKRPGELVTQPGGRRRTAALSSQAHHTTASTRRQSPSFPGDLSAALADTLALEEGHKTLADFHADTAAWHALRVLELRARRRQLEAYLPGGAT